MFPLAGNTFPRSSDALATSIRNALAEVFQLPANGSVVKIEGGKWPTLDRVVVDLSGAALRITEPPPRPVPQDAREPGITVGRLEVRGHPIRYEQSKLDLEMNARNLRFDFAHDVSGGALLVLADATDGHVQVEIGKNDLRSALLAAATVAAKPHGVTIQDLQLNLTSAGPRSLAGDLRVKAKKLMMSGVVHLRGKVDIDNALVATLSNLACSGEGVIGSMAAAMINTQLRAVEGQRIPLMAFSLGDVSLHDVKIAVKESVQVRADFGRQ